ncbi:MAG: ferredoxin family protein [Bacteroidota bacterium]
MTWVITKLCIDCIDTECIQVCPVNCIYALTTSDDKYPNQLYIHPEECIDCAACEPACPWEAIFQDEAVPEIFKEDTEINAQIFKDHPPEHFTTEPAPIKRHPTKEDVEANKKKWGFA